MFSMQEAQMTIPHLFKCPISLDLLTDPVTLCTGQTYNRCNIEKWLAAGNLTCPITMQKLHDPSLVPNNTLHHLIHQWLQMGCQVDHDFLNKIDSLAALEHNLESHESTLESKLRTLERIQVLCHEIPARNSSVLHLGFLPILLKLVFGNPETQFSQTNVKFVEESLSCVIKLLPFGEVESLNMLKEESNLASFINLFNNGTIFIQMSLCNLVEAIASFSETKELCVELIKTREILSQIVLLVSQNSAGIKALSALCLSESNQENLVCEGAVDGLIAYILNAELLERSLAARAIEAIEQLLGIEKGKEAFMKNPNGINVVVKMVFRVSDHEGSESAVNSLIVVCSECVKAREEAISAGILTQLLLLLQSQCDGRIKTKARMLLKMLRFNGTQKTCNMLCK